MADEPVVAEPSGPWGPDKLPRDQIARIYLTTAARWTAGSLGRSAAVGFRLQLRRRSKKGEKAEFVEFPNELSERTEYARTLATAQYSAAIFALETLASIRPDLGATKVPIELHTEYWEVDRVITGRSIKQLSPTHRSLQNRLREVRQGLQVVSISWGAKRRAAADRAPYSRQFGKLNNRLGRLARGEAKGEGPKFFINLYALRDLRQSQPGLAEATALEVLSYHVVKRMGRKAKDLAEAIGVPAKTVYNAVNRADRFVKEHQEDAEDGF